MEWLMDGVLLVFIGLLVALVTIAASEQSVETLLVYRILRLHLLVMAVISLFCRSSHAHFSDIYCVRLFSPARLHYYSRRHVTINFAKAL